MPVIVGLWLPGATLAAPGLALAGLAASPHCALMCGPLAALGARGANRPRALALTQAGRALGYAALGGLAGTGGQSLLHLLPATADGHSIQVTAALASLLVGAWLLLRAPARTACCAPPMAARRLPPLLRGLLWSLLPCALLYAVLLLAALSGGAASGALLAGAFALGGAPTLTLIAWLGARGPSTRTAARLSGAWLGGLGLASLLMLSAPAAVSLGWCLANR
jgi:sulfite exporter TauE/SafE